MPSVALASGKLIIGADDSVVDAAAARGNLYGAYNNVLTSGESVRVGMVLSARHLPRPSQCTEMLCRPSCQAARSQ